MTQYYIKDFEEESISAEDQCWDDETIAELRNKYNIYFMSQGREDCIPIKLLKEDGRYKIAFGGEDDGNIWFKIEGGRYKDMIDCHWLDALIDNLLTIREEINMSNDLLETLNNDKE